ncbi:MAG: FAD-binding oxidoreductase [Coleofasciculaceae cyanobacterium]
MATYDWIVVGGGITGAALAYELRRLSFTVLLLEQNAIPDNATRYSYGGLAYWSGTSELTRVLCQEGKEIHLHLSEELEGDTQFRELDLLLTIDQNDDPQAKADEYARFAIPATLLSVEEACQMEPLLNKEAIAAALTVRHGHINPDKTTQAYLQAFRRAGGEVQIAQVGELLRSGNQIKGVKTPQQNYYAANTVVCAGGLSRALLKVSGIHVPLYFTRAEMIETPVVEAKLQTIVMPADTKRFQIEAQASTADLEPLWDEPDHELVPAIIDASVVQFIDGSLRIGQISRVLTNPYAQVSREQSEATIRRQVGQVLPVIENLPGIWHDCLVAFSNNNLPVVGSIAGVEGVYVFSGFTNPLVFVPPLAKRFANWVAGGEDGILEELSPG